MGDRLDDAEPIDDVGEVQDEGASSGESWRSSNNKLLIGLVSNGWIS